MLRILLHQSNMIFSDYRVSLEVDMNVLVIILSLTLTEENGRKGNVHLVASQFWYWSSCVGGIPSWHLTDLAITSPISGCKQHKTRGVWGKRISCLQRVVYEMDEVKKKKKSHSQRHRDPSQTVIINLKEKELRSLRKGNETASKLMNITEDWNKLFLLHLVVLS